MAKSAMVASHAGGWVSLIERFVLVTLISLGGTTLVAASWARDMATPRVTVLGAGRGVAVLVTAGSSRVLILGGTDATELGNALAKARHPGLDRIDVAIVSGNVSAADLATRTLRLLQPRLVVAVGGDASMRNVTIEPGKIIDRSTEIELPDGVTIAIDVWPADGDDGEDVTWSVMIARGGASVYWVADREALMQETLPAHTDVTILGRGKPAADTPFPQTRVIIAAGESISGPELRAIALDSLGPEIETVRVFAGETTRIDLDPEGIRSVSGATLAGSPVAVQQ